MVVNPLKGIGVEVAEQTIQKGVRIDVTFALTAPPTCSPNDTVAPKTGCTTLGALESTRLVTWGSCCSHRQHKWGARPAFLTGFLNTARTKLCAPQGAQFCRRPLGRRTGSKWPKSDHFWVVLRRKKRHDIRHFYSAYASKSGWSLDDWASIDGVIIDPVNSVPAAF